MKTPGAEIPALAGLGTSVESAGSSWVTAGHGDPLEGVRAATLGAWTVGPGAPPFQKRPPPPRALSRAPYHLHGQSLRSPRAPPAPPAEVRVPSLPRQLRGPPLRAQARRASRAQGAKDAQPERLPKPQGSFKPRMPLATQTSSGWQAKSEAKKEHPRRCTYLKTRAPCHDKGTLGLSGVEQPRCECNFPAASTPGFAAHRARPLGRRDKAAGSSRVARADPRGAARRFAAAAARGAVAGPAGARLAEPSAQAEGMGAEGRGAGSRRRGGAAPGLAASSCEQGGGWGRQLLDSHFSLTPGDCALLSASS